VRSSSTGWQSFSTLRYAPTATAPRSAHECLEALVGIQVGPAGAPRLEATPISLGGTPDAEREERRAVCCAVRMADPHDADHGPERDDSVWLTGAGETHEARAAGGFAHVAPKRDVFEVVGEA
jgi:hypothetical protein